MESKIKTVEDAFNYTGRDLAVLNIFKPSFWEKLLEFIAKVFPLLKSFIGFPEDDREYMEAQYKRMVVTEALNKEANGGKEWTPDWEDGQYNKHYSWVWLKKNPKGVGFVVDGSDYAGTGTFTAVGSRLCLKDPNSVTHLNKKFADIIQIVMAE